jgi:hypothetical protein
MKRRDMILKLEEILVEAPEKLEEAAEYILFKLEKHGMMPPCVDGDKCQKLLRVYIDPNFNMWDEQFEEKMK